MKETTEIDIEYSETVVYKASLGKTESYCIACDGKVTMASPQTAAAMTGMTEREIYRLVEANTVHFIETDVIWICLNSIIKGKA